MLYRKEDIRKELTERMEFYKAAANAWKAVTRECKKDGSAFANFAKNFNGCKINTGNAYLYDNTATVYFTVGGKYENDSLTIGATADENTPAERIIKHPYIKGYYLFTVEETENAIKEHITTLETAAARKEEELNKLDTIYDNVKNAMETIAAYVKKETGSDNNSLYYAIEKAANFKWM
jgi:hypothetical protein